MDKPQGSAEARCPLPQTGEQPPAPQPHRRKGTDACRALERDRHRWGKVLANQFLLHRWLEFGSKRDDFVTYRKSAAD